MRRERSAQLRDGYISVSEVATLCGISFTTVHFWIRKKDKKIRARRVGMGSYAPWWVNVWDVLAVHNDAAGAWIEGSDMNAIREALRKFIADAIRSGELQKLQDDQPIATALQEQAEA